MRKYLLGLFLLVPSFTYAADVGDAAPDFTLKDESGTEHSLSAFAGKYVVLEWTNPDCPFVKRHARQETMKGLWNDFSEGGVVWLAINSTHYMKPEQNQKWREDQKLPYHILNDAEGTVGRAYGAKTTPHMFVIDKEGKIIYTGAIDDDRGGSKGTDAQNYVRQALSESMAGKPVTLSETKPYGCSVKYAG